MAAFVIQTLSSTSLIKARPIDTATSEGKPSEIAALTRGLVAHEEEAFREFHARYFDAIYQFLLVISHGKPAEAQEAVQETMIRIAKSPRLFTDEDAFWCWIKAVARNAARDGGRKQRRYLRLLESFARAWSFDPSPAPITDAASLTSLLEESLQELTPEERSLMEAKYLEGTPVRQLSERTGLTEKAVESRLLRLRKRLREQLLNKLNAP